MRVSEHASRGPFRILEYLHALAKLLERRSRRARTTCDDHGAILDDFHEAVETYEDAGRTARLVLGGAHPVTVGIETDVQDARSKLDAREA